MKTKSKYPKPVYIAFSVIFGVLAMVIVSKNIHHNEEVLNGIIGIEIFYIIWRIGGFVRREEVKPEKDASEFSKGLDGIMLTFSLVLMGCWAYERILDMILFLKK